MGRAVLIAWLSSFAADAGSTCYALHNGAREALMTQSCSKNAGLLAGQAAAEGWFLHKLAAHHPKFSAVLQGLDIGVHAGAAAHNVRQ